MMIFRELAADVRGATAIEYGLILALVFLAIIGAVQVFGLEVTQMMNRVSSTSVTAMAGA
nr:Flp family type IVb pilin [Altererythrobacter segetis]